MKRRSLSIVLAIVMACGTVFAQTSDRTNRRSAILNGNQVRTVFGNWGVIGQPGESGRRGAWKDDNNGYLGDVSPFVAAEVKWRDTTFRAAVFSPVARPQAAPRSEDPVTGKPWAFEPLSGYYAPSPNERVALSNDRSTWPSRWPGRPSSYDGKWDGYFGARANATLETYFALDDNNFERFSDSTKNARGISFRPDSRNPSRKGLALDMKVRALQWANFVAQDNIFWLYEITNSGTTTYDRAVFGMLVGTYVGVTSSENAGEYDDDWSFYDVNENITFTGDFGRNTARNPRWNRFFPVGMVGYAFLESPGNPFDGVDNDGDANVSTGAQFFQANSFLDTTTIRPGQRLVLIRDDFSRVLFTVPSADSVKVKTRGMRDSIWIYPNRTKRVPEGNATIEQGTGTNVVNPNAFDGVDNNFNGLIDENASLHYRQLKQSSTGQVLIDILRPVRYANYFSGAGTDALSLIDEKRNDRIDNDNDWSLNRATGERRRRPDGSFFDDVGIDGVPGTNDEGERDGLPTSGYRAGGLDTGQPGEPNMDKTDITESDQVGLSSFYYFTPAGDVSFGDDEEVWKNVAPGFFSVPTSIVQNRPQSGEDGDFFYSSGYFPLLAGATERFSLALVYGGGSGVSIEGDIADLLRHKRAVQQIYDANYQFPTAPDLPTFTAVPGDRQVTLYWDRAAEVSIDPVLQTNDFQGYKLYRSTDPNFSDIFTITNGRGNPVGYRPLKQWDIVDSVKGFFVATGDLFEAADGYAIYLGNDTGLEHSYVDRDVENGRKYYYALVAYDKGDNAAKIFPDENPKQITVLTNREIYDINVAVVTPNAKAAGYVPPSDNVSLSRAAGTATGSISYSVIDPTQLTGKQYTVTFLDTQVDGIDNNGNGRADQRDSTEWNRTTSFYFVKSEDIVPDLLNIIDTLSYNLKKRNIDPNSLSIKNESGQTIAISEFAIDYAGGSVRKRSGSTSPFGKYTFSYTYYPIYRSPYISGSPFARETKDANIFDGVQLNFGNDWLVSNVVDSTNGWSGVNAYNYSFVPLEVLGVNNDTVRSYRKPSDYEIRFSNAIVDTSVPDADLQVFPEAVPVNFRVFNKTDSAFVKFVFTENLAGQYPESARKLSPQDVIVLLELTPDGSRLARTWSINFSPAGGRGDSITVPLTTGDKLTIRTKKPFNERDVFRFTTAVPKVERIKAKNELDRIRVVPNPYVTASAFESPLPPGVTSGRGQRRIDFTNLPADAKINIFTSRGDHIVSLAHDSNIEDGTVSWNLKTKENLDIAYGIYFYVVESEVGVKTGKIAIIK